MQTTFLDQVSIAESEDCISMYDRDLKITGWNGACEKKFGFSYEWVFNRPLLDIFPYIVNDYRVICLKEAAQMGKSFYFSNLSYVYSKGYYSQAIVPLRNSEGLIIGALNIVRELQDKTNFTKKDLLLPLLKKVYTQENIAHLIS